MPSPGQLLLSMPTPDVRGVATLPEIPLERGWKDQPRSWPHAFHPLCTYLGSLPAALAHDLVARWSRPGDVVLDPFCGRGSVPLQACLERRTGVGIDRNPLATLLSGAALDPPTRRETHDRLVRLDIDWTHEIADRTAVAIAMTAEQGTAAAFFHPRTLAQLLFVRDRLDRRERTDRFLLATLAGVLHGRRPPALTDAMPNHFSMAPAYAGRWLAHRATALPDRDLFDVLRNRLDRVFREGTPSTRGITIDGDARQAGTLASAALGRAGLPDRIRLVITSPPYLGLIRYGAANWLRLWLLGEDPTRVDRALDRPASVEASTALVGQMLDDLRPHLADDAVVVLIVGQIESHGGRRRRQPLDLAGPMWHEAAEPLGYRLAGVADDAVDPGRKLTRLWGERAGQATRVDRLLVIAPTDLGRRRAIASATLPVDWSRTMGRVDWIPPRRATDPSNGLSSAPLAGVSYVPSHASEVLSTEPS